SVVDKFIPHLDPDNKARLIEWASDNINENKIMFPNPLNLDIEALQAYAPPPPQGAEPGGEQSGMGGLLGAE
ncbi:MAG TPA: hypothetical protein VFM46_17430, partial [Pseudomonadales bacterium]|nr:hypothetical protein [Pseudomonadales bacterium]